jgi:hypothetical protein
MSTMADQPRIPRRFLAAALVTILLAGGVFVALRAQSGAVPPADQWRQALDEWDAGDYQLALPRLVSIMRSPVAQEYLERVALLTGEFHPSIAIANDGRLPKLSANGQFVTFETGPTTEPVTRVVRAAAGGPLVAELPGAGAAINTAGTHVVWIRPVKTPEWIAAQTILATPGPNTPERQAAAATVSWLAATAGDLVVRDLASGTERVIATTNLAKSTPVFAADDRSVLFIGSEAADLSRTDIYRVSEAGAPERLTADPGFKTLLTALQQRRYAIPPAGCR